MSDMDTGERNAHDRQAARERTSFDIYPIPATPLRIKVTPDMAADWLANRNVSTNRNLSEHIANKYAKIMRDGRWLSTHQGIAFDKEGWLIDGQHRLRAVVLTGITVEMFIVPDCDPATFAVLDSGHKRTAGQMVKVPGARSIAAAGRVLAIVTGAVVGTNTQGGVYDGSLTTDIILDVVDAWPELATFVGPVGLVYQNAKINQPLHLAVIVQAARSNYAHRIDPWIDGLAHGVALNDGDPRLLLRNRYIKDSTLLNAGSNRGLAYNLIVKAWNAHARQRTMGTLRVVDGEGVLSVID